MGDGFGALLRRHRRAAGMTQQALADHAGVSVGAIHTLETGRRRQPHGATLALLAEALGLSEIERRQLAEVAAAGTAAGVDDFVGREAELAGIVELLTGPRRPGTVAVSAVNGMGGVGKTALALQVTRRVGDAFPDGMLWVDLAGFGPTEPADPYDAVCHVLRLLGTPPAAIPDTLAEATARYRSATADRHLLVVLDNAAGHEQVLPLLPGGSGCAVVVTSRRLLSVIPGARHLRLDVLSPAEAVELLGRVAGARAGGATAEIEDLIEQCGRLPLAIRIAGARLASRSRLTVARLAARLRDERQALDQLSQGDAGVRASLSFSLADLRTGDEDDADAATALPMLALLDSADFDDRLAAAQLGRPPVEAALLLGRLVDVNLLEPLDTERYRLHDLVRAYAREDARRDLEPAVIEAARTRVLDLYAAMAWRCEQLAGMKALSEQWLDPAWIGPARDEHDLDALVEWLDHDRVQLVEAVRAAATGSPQQREIAVRIGCGINRFCVRQKRWLEWRDLSVAALDALGGRPDEVAEAQLRFNLGLAYGEFDAYDQAARELRRVVEITTGIGAAEAQVMSTVNLARLLERLDLVAEGIEMATRGLRLAEEYGDHHYEAWALLVLGMVAGKAGRVAEQARCYARALALAEMDDSSTLARFHLQIGRSLVESGRLGEALDHLEHSRRLFSAAAAPLRQAESHDEIGRTLIALDRPGEAIETLRQGLRLARDGQRWDREASIQYQLADAFAAIGDRVEAERSRRAADEIHAHYGVA